MRKLKEAITYLALILFGLACIYPLAWMFFTSLKTPQEALSNPTALLPQGAFNWKTYLTVWERLNFFRYFINSLSVSTFAVIGVIILYSLTGFAIAKLKFKGKNFFFYLYISLMLVPGLTVIIPLYANMTKFGLNDNFFGIVLPMINGGGPFAVFLFTNYFKTLPHEMYESSVLDGCNKFQIYLRIFMPLAIPAITTIAISNFVGTWNDIMWPLIILNKRDLFTLPVGLLYLDNSSFRKWNELMAGAMFSVIPVLLMFTLLQKYYIEGLSAGAVKI